MKVHLSDGEWKLMNKLWDASPCTITELTAALREETGWSKNTVITMLSRLNGKKAVYYEEGLRAKQYYPAVTREEAIRKMMAALSELVVWGTQNNIEDQIEIIRDERFKKGDYYTDFMKTFQGPGN